MAALSHIAYALMAMFVSATILPPAGQDADSLAGVASGNSSLVSPPDSLSNTLQIPDSLHIRLTDPAFLMPETDPVAGIFGSESRLLRQGIYETTDTVHFSADILYQLLVLALLVIYIHLVLSKSQEALLTLRLILTRAKEGRSPEDYQSVLSGFTRSMLGAGLLSVGIYIAKIIEIWSVEGYGGNIILLPDAVSLNPGFMVLGISAICGSIYFVQSLFLGLAGRITFEIPFIRTLSWMKVIFLTGFSILAIPAILFAALAPVYWAKWFIYLATILVVMLFIWYACRSAKLFVSQKVSILFWFLYLCAVELMPFGIVILAAYRSVAG